MHYIAKTSVVPKKKKKKKLIQVKQGTQECYVKIIDQPWLQIQDL